MEITIYFADKSVIFTTEQSIASADTAILTRIEAITRDKVVKILESHNSVRIVHPSIEEAFARFAQDFTVVEAAGGLVVDEQGRWLMIRRNKRWDLPKGHIEAGESHEECAVREIAEETGVESRVVRPLCATWHAYWFPPCKRWELKRTWWHEMSAEGSAVLKPQAEEGIVEVVWVEPADRPRYLREAFNTIRTVAERLRSMQDEEKIV